MVDESVVPPAGGVTGFVANVTVMPEGMLGVLRLTGDENVPIENIVVVVVEDPP